MKTNRYHIQKGSSDISDSASGSKVSDFHFHTEGKRDVLGYCSAVRGNKPDFDGVDVERPRASFVFDAVDSRVMCWGCRHLIRPYRMSDAVKEWWVEREEYFGRRWF